VNHDFNERGAGIATMKIQGKTFFITGGGSMIGTHTAEELIQAGAREVILFDNLSFGTPEEHLAGILSTGRARLIQGDVLDAPGVRAACAGVDGVFALAGFMSSGIAKTPGLALDVNIKGVLNVLEGCREHRVGKVVLASSSAAYGYGRIRGAIKEEEPFHSFNVPPPAALYGASKVVAEQLCRLYRLQHGVDFLALRFSTVYGERQHYRSTNALYIIDAYDRVAKGERPILYGDGMETKDFVYVRDVARANRMAMESDASGEAMNISGGKPLTVRFLAETVIRLAGASVEPEYREAPEHGIRITSDAAFHYDNSAAKRLIGWSPEVTIEDGIGRLIAWRRNMSTEPGRGA
jgi:UDP-glucose 4-epimerase